MNQIQRKKLKLSKWTAVRPSNSEKHFIVTGLIEEEGQTLQVLIEAIHSKRESCMLWTKLKDDAVWRPGWR